MQAVQLPTQTHKQWEIKRQFSDTERTHTYGIPIWLSKGWSYEHKQTSTLPCPQSDSNKYLDVHILQVEMALDTSRHPQNTESTLRGTPHPLLLLITLSFYHCSSVFISIFMLVSAPDYLFCRGKGRAKHSWMSSSLLWINLPVWWGNFRYLKCQKINEGFTL